MKHQFLLVAANAALLTFLTGLQMGCSGTSSSSADSTANVVQSAVAETNSQAQASESSTVIGMSVPEEQEDLQSTEIDGSIRPLSTCTLSSVRGTCSSGVDTIAWNGCTIYAGTVAMTGGWTETFSGTGASSCTIPVASGGSVVRTTSSSVATTSKYIFTTDTSGGTAYDGTVIPGTGTGVSNSSGTRTITINGTHKLATNLSGTTIYNHYITTPTPIQVTGTRAAGTRTITAGTVKVYHEIAKYTASLSFSGVQWTDSTCCFPTTGTVTATFTGTSTGTTTTTFSSTCGSATYVDTTGATSTIALTQCM